MREDGSLCKWFSNDNSLFSILPKKSRFPLRIYLVNGKKSAVSYGFVHVNPLSTNATKWSNTLKQCA